MLGELGNLTVAPLLRLALVSSQEAYKMLRKSAVERSERRMYWEMFYEENYEDENAVLNATTNNTSRGGPVGGSGVAAAMAAAAAAAAANESVDRQDSVGSMDSYNSQSTTHSSSNNYDVMSRSASQSALRHNSGSADGAEQRRGLRNSASLDENAMHHQAAVATAAALRENVQRSDSEPTAAARGLSLPRHGAAAAVNDYNLSDSSPNGSPALMRGSHAAGGGAERLATRKHKMRADARRSDSQSSGEGPTGGMISRLHAGPGASRYKTIPHETVPEEQQQTVAPSRANGGRLNQRRTLRTDKRYYTADAIEDIRKEQPRDGGGSGGGAIQKRRSWNFGTVDINIDDRQNYLQSKTISSDSLRSMPSSSGVSSTGSLHLSPESEIYEELEYEDDGLPECAMINARGNSPHVHFIDQQHSDGSSTNESSVTLTESLEPLIDSDSEISQSKSNKHSRHHPRHSAKSLGAAAAMAGFSVKDVQDGVASAEMRAENGSKKKMSHGDLLRMKKQLLLNSTVEAS